jgi:hypothetical protein
MYTLLIAPLLSLNVISSSQRFDELPESDKIHLQEIVIYDGDVL